MAEEKSSDTGLGLNEFLGEKKPSGNGDKPSTDNEEQKPNEPSEKKEGEKEDVSTQEKTKEEEPKKTKEIEEEKVSETEKPKKKEKDYEKQYKDTRNWATSINDKNIKLEKEIRKLKGEDVSGDEDKAKNADLQGRISASQEIAFSTYGEEWVKENIDDPLSEYQKLRKENPAIDLRVSSAKTPYLEAIKTLKEERFFKEYGRDTEVIITKIKDKHKEELTKLITKELQEKLEQKDKLPKDISGVTSSIISNDDAFKATPLSNILGQK